MPRNRPATTGYERLAQADQFSDGSDAEDDIAGGHLSAPRYASIVHPPRANAGMGIDTPTRPTHTRRRRSSSGVDLKAINARLERWAEEIAAKFKRGRRRADADDDDEPLEIQHSVFQAPDGVRPATPDALSRPEPGYMSKTEFEGIVEGVRVAIEQGVHPRLILQGSSGSYFAQTTEGKVVGVFKPKDEEPYAAGNPKWNKWIHRNLFPCCFGRACLIPNLSYVSEAAAYVLDCQLRTHLVPYTDVVYLSSKSFHYPFWDRYNYSRKKKPLPAKPGSFQVFLKGFKDANVFLREHPWPDQYWSGFLTTASSTDPHRNRRKHWSDNCRPSSKKAGAAGGEGDEEDGYDEDGNEQAASPPPGPGNFAWNEALKQSFREELEKLVVLDYIMRNTDRGLDNWMVKVDYKTNEVRIVSDPVQMHMETAANGDAAGPRPVDLSARGPQPDRASYPYRAQKPMDASSSPANGAAADTKMTLGAIDNSLSWPWKHPDAWRSFPFGWLFLPVDLIGRPFSQKTRDHFLPLLTSTHWWSQTQLALRKVFQLDSDFQERMFARQIAVMKGQAWNVVETLKTPDHGPLELTRRAKVCVWDDLVDVPVAVPMRAPSADMVRRRTEETAAAAEYASARGRALHEEMDIGAANSTASRSGTRAAAAAAGAATTDPAAVDDLLSLATPPGDIPHPGRFDLVSPIREQPPPSALDTIPDAESSPATAAAANGRRSDSSRRPRLPRSSFAASFHAGSASRPSASARGHERHYSFAGRRRRRSSSSSLARQLYGDAYDDADDDDYDELEAGDLGYAAAEGMESSQRKVIVERLEAVKSKNPVFTWC